MDLDELLTSHRYDDAYSLAQKITEVTLPLPEHADDDLDEADDYLLRERLGLDGDGGEERALPSALEVLQTDCPGSVGRAFAILSLLAHSGCGGSQRTREAKRLALMGWDRGSFLCLALYGCYLVDVPHYARARGIGLPLQLIEHALPALAVLYMGEGKSADGRDPLRATIHAYAATLLGRDQCHSLDMTVAKLKSEGYEVIPLSADLHDIEAALRTAGYEGIAFALYVLGRHYEAGMLLDQAAGAYRRAYEGGVVPAAWHLGCCYELGKGVQKNTSSAFELFEVAASRGSVEGTCSLGWAYLGGIGCTKEPRLAFEQYMKAAEQGDCKAQNNVGALYTEGRGVDAADHQMAVKWFVRACDQGYKYSQYYLGWMYQKGKGVKKDLIRTTQLYYEASRGGHTAAEKWLSQQGHRIVQRNLLLWRAIVLSEDGWYPALQGELGMPQLIPMFKLVLLCRMSGKSNPQAEWLYVMPREILFKVFTEYAIGLVAQELRDEYHSSLSVIPDVQRGDLYA